MMTQIKTRKKISTLSNCGVYVGLEILAHLKNEILTSKMSCIKVLLQLFCIVCFSGTNLARKPDLEIVVKESGPVILNTESDIQIGLHYSGIEPNFDIVVTFLPEETENPVVEISADPLFFSSSEMENSVTKNLTVKGIILGYTTVKVRKF